MDCIGEYSQRPKNIIDAIKKTPHNRQIDIGY